MGETKTTQQTLAWAWSPSLTVKWHTAHLFLSIGNTGTKVIMLVLFVSLWTGDFRESGLQTVKLRMHCFYTDIHIFVAASNWSAAEVNCAPLTFPKSPYYPRDLVWRQGTDFFFFLMTLTFWKTSSANRLVLSCLMWSKFLIGHVTSNSFLDVHFKNTNKPIQDPTSFIFFFQVNLGKCGVDQKDGTGAIIFPGRSLRPRI